jgi:hypothetical protein
MLLPLTWFNIDRYRRGPSILWSTPEAEQNHILLHLEVEGINSNAFLLTRVLMKNSNNKKSFPKHRNPFRTTNSDG